MTICWDWDAFATRGRMLKDNRLFLLHKQHLFCSSKARAMSDIVSGLHNIYIYIYRWFAHRWSVVKPINRFSQPPLAGVHPEASEYGSLRPWNLGTSQTWTVGTCWKMLKLWNFGIAAAWRLYSANFSNMLFKLPVLLQLKVTKLLQWEDRASSGKKLELQDLCRW